ncbi:NAD(P)-dependent oxidoreductase [Winogradskyella schleiferi]|uniref:NAD(P)-dependent oxidoreductase n=1 Tax=Winogradskyella schleiferi TaxID=2686078 RepID=UPI0015BBDEFB|nr:NAD(P)-binding oxidoreductase [Winogradskyella schleiferi]
MTVLVVGASGATGSKLVEQLLIENYKVKVIVRTPKKLPESWKTNSNLEIISASVLDLSDAEMAEIVQDCNAVASCLGHNLTWKGVYGKPRRLVTDATRRLCEAIKSNHPQAPIKFVLMNTTGNRNRDLSEPISFAQKCVIGLLRLLLPPHVDNEKAADYLRTQIGQNDKSIEWVAVRPDGLINEEDVSDYEIHVSPIRSAIFNAGKVSRINVAHFMASLINDADLWSQWKGQMPVIYSVSNQD